MPSSACDWSSDVCSSDRSEEHTSELQSRSDLVCRIIRSEEHTSELQSRSDLVCRLLLEKKKKDEINKRRNIKTIDIYKNNKRKRHHDYTNNVANRRSSD